MNNSPKIYVIGDDILKEKCDLLHKNDILNNIELLNNVKIAHQALNNFKELNGFGRAIAAPQVGFKQRFIALNLNDKGSFTMFNPEIIYKSEETFTMWDDCLSFPNLMACVRRHKCISLKYLDENGIEIYYEKLSQSLSELLQHEIDHLDGILAVDIAINPPNNLNCNKIIDRIDYLNNKNQYLSYVDNYSI